MAAGQAAQERLRQDGSGLRRPSVAAHCGNGPQPARHSSVIARYVLPKRRPATSTRKRWSQANTRDWADFVKRYNETVAETRTGRVDAMNAPLVISSLGAFGVRTAAPIVVPPSIGTLFVGSAHYETIGEGKKSQPAEVITLSLTFDHRVVNGAAAANFVHDIKERIESFKIPTAAESSKT